MTFHFHYNLKTFNLYSPASFGVGFRKLKMPRNDKTEILCMLVEFFQLFLVRMAVTQPGSLNHTSFFYLWLLYIFLKTFIILPITYKQFFAIIRIIRKFLFFLLFVLTLTVNQNQINGQNEQNCKTIRDFNTTHAFAAYPRLLNTCRSKKAKGGL